MGSVKREHKHGRNRESHGKAALNDLAVTTLLVSVVFQEEEKSELNETDEEGHELEHINRPQRRLEGSLLAEHKQLEGDKDAYHDVGDYFSGLDTPDAPLLRSRHYSAKLNSINLF